LFSRIRENFSVFRRVNEDESLFFQAVFTKTSMILFSKRLQAESFVTCGFITDYHLSAFVIDCFSSRRKAS